MRFVPIPSVIGFSVSMPFSLTLVSEDIVVSMGAGASQTLQHLSELLFSVPQKSHIHPIKDFCYCKSTKLNLGNSIILK